MIKTVVDTWHRSLRATRRRRRRVCWRTTSPCTRRVELRDQALQAINAIPGQMGAMLASMQPQPHPDGR